MNLFLRIFCSIVILGFLLASGIMAQSSLLAWCGIILLMLPYLLIIWAAEAWWTYLKYAGAVSLVLILALGIHLLNVTSDYDSALLAPLIPLLAKEQRELRYFTASLAVVTLGVFLVIIPFSIALTWLESIIPLYFSIRAINIYKEAHRLSQRHVRELAETYQELERTHEALQEASISSVRYAALSERARLAREVHDGVGHQLTSLIIQLQALEIMLPGDPRRAVQTVPSLLGTARQAMTEARQAAQTWQEDESELGLIALRGLVSQCAARTSLTLAFEQDEKLSDWSFEVSVVLYRVLQEALTNIMRHAHATHVSIQVQERDQQVLLTITDNGSYTTNQSLSWGQGIKGMMARSQTLGGTCSLTQNQPSGLILQVRLPLSPSPAEAGPVPRPLTDGRMQRVEGEDA